MMDIIYSVYSLNADRERTEGADSDDKHSSNIEAPQLHANRVFQVRTRDHSPNITLYLILSFVEYILLFAIARAYYYYYCYCLTYQQVPKHEKGGFQGWTF